MHIKKQARIANQWPSSRISITRLSTRMNTPARFRTCSHSSSVHR